MSARLPLADIQFIAEFAAFCRAKGDEQYDYCANGNCAIAQFLKSTGRAEDPWVAGYGFWGDHAKGEAPLKHRTPEGVAGACNDLDERFSALADRLEALIADAPVVVRS